MDIDKEHISYMKAPITNKTPNYTVTLREIHQAVTDPEIYKKQTFEYRKHNNQGEDRRASEIKQGSFDYVTFSGKFKYVSNNSLIVHSNLICIDIDKIGDKHDTKQVRQTLLDDENIDTAMLFISPSANGIKWVVGIDVDQSEPHKTHKSYFRAISAYMQQAYNIEIDQACKDVARACYLPYDPECVLNEDAKPLGSQFLEMWEPAEETPNVFKKKKNSGPAGEVTPWDDYNKNGDLEQLLTKHGWSYVGSTEKGDEYLRPGNSSNRYSAVHFHDTNLLYVHSDSTQLEVGDNTPAKVFCQLEARGDWKKASRMLKERGYGKQPKLNITSDSENPPEAEVYVFWDKTKDGGITINKDSYVQFLEKELNYAQVRAYGRMQLVKLEGKVMYKTDVDDIIQETRKYIEDNIDQGLRSKVREAFMTLLGTISREVLTKFIKEVDYEMEKETPDNAYFYYRNKFVEVVEDDIIVKDYDDLDLYIWDSQRLDRDWQGETSFKDFSFFKFLQNVTNHDKDRWDSMRSAIGYLLHSYKNRAKAKAIIFIDEFVPSQNINASNGGTGKSILGEALSHMKQTCMIDGKNFNTSNQFSLSKVQFGDKLVFIDDIKKGFDFEDLYVQITSDLEYERKYENKVTIPFEESPKIMIASNKALKSDDGSSDKRRQAIIEFAPHYHPDFTPEDEFGEVFFDNYHWDLQDWQKFDSLMIHCLQFFFQNGGEVIECPVSYEYRKILERIGPEVLEFCNENIELGKFYTTEQLYNGNFVQGGSSGRGFSLIYDDYEISKTEFARRLRLWADFKNIEARRVRGKKENRGKRGWEFVRE